VSDARASLLGVHVRRDDANAIARLAASADVSETPRRAGRSAQARMVEDERQRLLAAGELHVVASVSYGDGRRATCAACSFAATGKSDDEMAASFARHIDRAKSTG
jgi:hypothetical protein